MVNRLGSDNSISQTSSRSDSSTSTQPNRSNSTFLNAIATARTQLPESINRTFNREPQANQNRPNQITATNARPNIAGQAEQIGQNNPIHDVIEEGRNFTENMLTQFENLSSRADARAFASDIENAIRELASLSVDNSMDIDPNDFTEILRINSALFDIQGQLTNITDLSSAEFFNTQRDQMNNMIAQAELNPQDADEDRLMQNLQNSINILSAEVMDEDALRDAAGDLLGDLVTDIIRYTGDLTELQNNIGHFGVEEALNIRRAEAGEVQAQQIQDHRATIDLAQEVERNQREYGVWVEPPRTSTMVEMDITTGQPMNPPQ
ncbi:hypothetical protein TDB9533_03764 [Thalassocella blandensis]|nr:hypothetical protein TDB9533_03764 [Thalassocella blandensis]